MSSAHQDDDEDGEYDDDEVENIKPGDKSASAVEPATAARYPGNPEANVAPVGL